MERHEWRKVCFEIAKEYPEYLQDTFEAFSAGVRAQAEMNSEKVANMGYALSFLYMKPKDKEAKSLANKRLLESNLFKGTKFEEELLQEAK